MSALCVNVSVDIHPIHRFRIPVKGKKVIGWLRDKVLERYKRATKHVAFVPPQSSEYQMFTDSGFELDNEDLVSDVLDDDCCVVLRAVDPDDLSVLDNGSASSAIAGSAVGTAPLPSLRESTFSQGRTTKAPKPGIIGSAHSVDNSTPKNAPGPISQGLAPSAQQDSLRSEMISSIMNRELNNLPAELKDDFAQPPTSFSGYRSQAKLIGWDAAGADSGEELEVRNDNNYEHNEATSQAWEVGEAVSGVKSREAVIPPSAPQSRSSRSSTKPDTKSKQPVQQPRKKSSASSSRPHLNRNRNEGRSSTTTRRPAAKPYVPPICYMCNKVLSEHPTRRWCKSASKNKTASRGRGSHQRSTHFNKTGNAKHVQGNGKHFQANNKHVRNTSNGPQKCPARKQLGSQVAGAKKSHTSQRPSQARRVSTQHRKAAEKKPT